MDQRIILVLNPEDRKSEKKKSQVEKKFGAGQIDTQIGTKSLMEDTDLSDTRIIIDFDVSNYEHVELIEHLKSLKEKGISFDFLADILDDKVDQIIVSSELRSEIDSFVKQLLPVREKISNKFLRPPILRMQDKNFMFSHQDEEGLYFFSKKEVHEKTLELIVMIEVEGDSKEVKCRGEVDRVTPFDEDTTRKYFYNLTLDDSSKNQLKDYFKAVETLAESINTWAIIDDKNEE